MRGINKVILVGRAGKDAEIKYFETGKAKTSFSLATSEGKDKDGQEITMWHNIVMWAKTAELAAQWVHKGRLIYIEGRITYREYVDKQGQKQRITEIVATDFQLLDSPKTEPVSAGASIFEDPELGPEDLPF